MTAPTTSEVLAEIARALHLEGEGQTMRELEALGRTQGYGRRRIHAAIRTLILEGKVQVVIVRRPDLAGRDQSVIGYRFV